MTVLSDGARALLGGAGGAVGLTSMKEGFAWEPAFDRLFALGWPHVRFVVDGHGDDAEAGRHATTAIDGSLEGHYFVQWPRQVALRYVRAFGGRGSGAFTTRNAFVSAAVGAETPQVTEAEAREMLAARVRAGGPTGTWFTEHFVLLLEALVGTEVVLDALTGALEGEVGTDEEVEQLAYAVGFLLLRVDAGVAEHQRARLRAVLERAGSDDYLHDGLACALGGGAAARSMGRNPIYYHHVIDDPEAVREAVEAGRWLPSARHVFLGGEAVLEAVAPHWKKQKDAELQRKLALQLAPIRSPVAVRILADMGGRSKVKRELPGICARFSEHMRPDLERLAEDAAVGAGARALLAAWA